jgi:hypothetical protein
VDLAAALKRVILYEGRIATAGEPIEHHGNGYHASKQLLKACAPATATGCPQGVTSGLCRPNARTKPTMRSCNSRSLPVSASAPARSTPPK